MPNSHPAVNTIQIALMKNLTDESQTGMAQKGAAISIRGYDSRAFLASMLQGMQPELSQSHRVFMSINAE